MSKLEGNNYTGAAGTVATGVPVVIPRNSSRHSLAIYNVDAAENLTIEVMDAPAGSAIGTIVIEPGCAWAPHVAPTNEVSVDTTGATCDYIYHEG